MSDLEKAELKVEIAKAIEKIICKRTESDNNLGWIPPGYETKLASMVVIGLDLISSTSRLIEENNE